MILRSLALSCLITRGLLATDFVSEAALPVGWPAPAEPGVINLTELPAYRAAEGPGFWSLFAHIKAGGIEMTAPVAMQADTDPNSGIGSMRFLYPSTKTAKGPEDGVVKVIDVEPQQVLRVAWRGQASKEQREAYRQQVDAAAKERGYEVVGEPMWFGYNSPMLARDKRTWEVALPVTKKEEDAK